MTSSSEDRPIDLKLPVMHPVRVAFADVFEYQINRLQNCSLSNNRKTAASTAKLAKRMEKIQKPDNLEGSDPLTTLSFQRRFEQTYESNGVSEGVVL